MPTDNLTPLQQAEQAINILVDKMLALKSSLMGRMIDGHPVPTLEQYQAALNLTVDMIEFACEVKRAAGGEAPTT